MPVTRWLECLGYPGLRGVEEKAFLTNDARDTVAEPVERPGETGSPENARSSA